MAVVDFKVVELNANQQYPTGVRVVVWEGLDTGDTATAYSAPQYAGKAVQIETSTATSVTMQGSLVPPNAVPTPVWGTLHKVDLTDLVLIDAEPQQVLEDCYQVRPNVTTGSDVDVYLLVTTTSRR